MAKKKQEEQEIIVEQKKSSQKDYILSVGRRREAVARVRLYPKTKEELFWGEMVLEKGKMYVNQIPVEQYFSNIADKVMYTAPFKATNTLDIFTVAARVVGGGKHGQLEAFVHGIARALVIYNPAECRLLLKKKGLLTRDARARQRRKVGMGGKSRREKQSPKR